ncbi:MULTISPECIES: hypothetical protein [Halolamina]|uniref:DUF6199 domain-containing protein n=1 Tax=Halolamina pelagica TaxID=699431 RepID=A0A1I5QAU6_9EURY|nr:MULTISPECIES: hypothetical protein [Halolamina]NHX35178.1 hypothetical protein [Halolamina sp. R1-12]SFP43363.1 hypothetical protein SAMN05216277_103339 [Halolamina pelagica]
MLLRALTFVTGIAGAAGPEKLLDVCARSMLAGYENPEDLEPSEWYVDATRYAGLLLAVAALIAPFLPTPSEGDDEEVEDGPVVDVIESSDD